MAESKKLSEIPPTFPKEYTYKIEKDIIKVKEVCDEASAKKWMDEYQKSSRTTWTTARTYPTSGYRVTFKHQWKCHFKVQDKSIKKTKCRLSKNLLCPALITATVYRVVKKSKSKLRLEAEYPCHLEVQLEHNHLLDTAAILRHNRMSDETEEKLLDLFKKGHTAATARESLKLEIYVNDIENYHQKAADNSIIPTLSTVQYLFNKTFQNTYGAKRGEDMFKDLDVMLKKYTEEELDGRAKAGKVGENIYAVICTPIMSRAHKILPQASELVLVDCSSNMDKDCHRVYMLVTPGPPGGVPLGCIVTDVEKKDVFKVALGELVKVLPEDSFYAKRSPRVIMTDDDLKERDPLREVWPSSELLLCQFHLLKAHWKWLLTAAHNIDKKDRQSMYFAFKRIVRGSSEEDLEEAYKLLKAEYGEKYDNYGKYVDNVYNRRKEWADAYRVALPIRGNNTTNYVETIFRILKDCIFERVKAHSLTQLIDFILIRYEGYMMRRLIDFAHDRYCKAMIRKYLPKDVDDIDVSKIICSDTDPTCYYVPSKSKPGEMHLVDPRSGFCACPGGRGGKLCRHLNAVLQNFSLSDEMFIVSPSMKAAAFEIATGSQPAKSWLLPLHTRPGEEDSEINQTKLTSRQDQNNDSKKEDIERTMDESETTTEEEELTGQSSTPILSEGEQEELENLFNRIKNGAQTNPEVFVPAIQTLLKNVRNFVKTDSALTSAIHTFGRYSGQAAVTSTNTRQGDMIGVQPTSVGRRRQCLGGKRRIEPGRTPGLPKRPRELQSHDYTAFGSLPVNKIRAPHSLQFCVEKNVGLPSKKRSEN